MNSKVAVPIRQLQIEHGGDIPQSIASWFAAALQTPEREEQQYKAKLAGLQPAIDEGDASGIAKGNVFERVGQKLNLPPKPR